MVDMARRGLLAVGAASLASKALGSSPPPVAVIPPPPGPIDLAASATVAPHATLPEDALPMLCGRRWFGHPEGDFVGATEDKQGLGRVWALHTNGDGGPARMEPVTGLSPMKGLRALTLDNGGRPWAVQVDAGRARLVAADQRGWPTIDYDLTDVVHADSDLRDLIVDIWDQYRAVIAGRHHHARA